MGSRKVYSQTLAGIIMEEHGQYALKVFAEGGQIPASYFHTRFITLRKPLGFALGSERLQDDLNALHACIQINDEIVSVGRVHHIDDDSDGSQVDHTGPGAPLCPGFPPLTKDNGGINGIFDLRPACQIRQMGTLEQWRRKGFAAIVLAALEKGAVEKWGCKSGWLQARLEAVQFYLNAGWVVFSEEYDIAGVGIHISMYKILE